MKEQVIQWFIMMWNMEDMIHDYGDDNESYNRRQGDLKEVAEKYPEEYIAAKLRYRKVM